MENNQKVECKSCHEEISKDLKICPHCGKDQRNFFKRHMAISLISLIVVITAVFTLIIINRNDNSEYFPYNYGDIIKRDNAATGMFKLDKDFKISIDNEEIVTKEQLNEISMFNNATKNVAVLTITMRNDSNNEIVYDSSDFNFITHKDVKISNIPLSIILPSKFESFKKLDLGN